MKMEQSVPKRRHIKFRRRGITQKKAYNKYRDLHLVPKNCKVIAIFILICRLQLLNTKLHGMLKFFLNLETAIKIMT